MRLLIAALSLCGVVVFIRDCPGQQPDKKAKPADYVFADESLARLRIELKDLKFEDKGLHDLFFGDAKTYDTVIFHVTYANRYEVSQIKVSASLRPRENDLPSKAKVIKLLEKREDPDFKRLAEVIYKWQK